MHLEFPNSDDFLMNLVLQRTEQFILLGGGKAISVWLKTGDKNEIKKLIHDKVFIKNYLTNLLIEINKEAKKLVNIISTEETKHFCSIGPGNGLLELILIKELNIKKILLIDIEKSKSHNHSFNEEGSGYANLHETKNFFIQNGINQNSILCCNPTKEKIPRFKINLLISLLSMGFHYPCNMYADFIINNTQKNSIIILDKRFSTIDNGFEELKNYFSVLEKINHKKYHRLKLKKI